MISTKDWNTALGAETHCPNFDPCPLCFGCRNYSTAVLRCEKCENNKKQNICNTKKHTEQALQLMLRFSKSKTIIQDN